MTVVDGVILLLILLMALQGYARGFIVGVAALLGFIGGAVIGSRIGPLVLTHGSHSPDSPLFALGGAIILGGFLGAVSEGVARRVRRFVWVPGLRLADGLLGALLTACVALGLAWIVGAAALQTADQFKLPVNVRHDIEHSLILRNLNKVLPPSGPILDALARVDPLSTVQGRVADVPAPAKGILRLPLVRAASASVVRVLGNACQLGIEGSGWVAGPGIVVTNAHVVAGETDTVVQLRGVGPQLRAQVLVFDPHNDIAVLNVPGLSAPVLTLASGPASGTSAAILGFPLDGGFAREPGRLGRTQRIPTENAYDNPTVRSVASLRGLIRPGNSGGPMVDAAGQVVATVFAEITGTPAGAPGGLAVPNSVVAGELRKASAVRVAVGTGSCAD